MTDTVNLGLPCIEGSQAQKHVTHNDALRILDTLVQLAVLDRDLTAPPGSPAEGQRWIVKAGATGLWAGHDNAIAAWQDGAWLFSAPKTGWVAFVVDEGTLLVWNGSAWGDFFSTVTSIQNLARLGLGTTADATNPLSGKLNNALFAAKTVAEGGDGNLRYTLSKESAAKSLSFLFQDNYSGRAEIGLAGDDNFHFNVSPDGSTWYEGIRIDRASGKLSFPASGGPRELLTANRTYYVRTDGNDGNSGLANSAGGAFLTLQKAIDTVASIDLSIYDVTIQVGAGTYTAGAVFKTLLGAGKCILLGDTATPSNVVISVTNGNCLGSPNSFVGHYQVKGFKLVTTTSGTAVRVDGGAAAVDLFEFELGACATAGLTASYGADITLNANWSITGSNGGRVLLATGIGARIRKNASLTCTLTGTPSFAVFAQSEEMAEAKLNGITFTGSGTGKRYDLSSNALILTGGTTLPGTIAGTNDGTGIYL